MKELKDLEKAISKLLKKLPVDDEVRQNTPKRFVDALHEMLHGYATPIDAKSFDLTKEPVEQIGDLVVIRNAPVRSLCEHHLLPFYGYAHIAYVPGRRVMGFSKFARIVDVFSHRLQLQERLTKQVADAVKRVYEPLGLMLIVECTHTCALVRGVKTERMHMRTSALRGIMRFNPYLKQEAMDLLLR